MQLEIPKKFRTNNEIFLKHIISIYDECGKKILYNNLSIKDEFRSTMKFSTSKVLYIDGVALSGKQMKHFKIDYKCRCGRIQNILLHKFLKKEIIWCASCVQDRNFEIYVSANEKGKKSKPKELKNANLCFDDMSDEFKQNYISTHVTPLELSNIIDNIYSICGKVLTNEDRKNYIYNFTSPTNNQMRFIPKISFDEGKTYYSFKDIFLICSKCGKHFKIHATNLKKRYTNTSMNCRDCELSNTTYKINIYKNTDLTYQSSLEFNFLEWCSKNNITVMNGLVIPYVHNGKLKLYHTDFYLPDFKIILELKGTNHYYRQDIESGRIENKNSAAIKYAKSIGGEFKFILDKDIESFYDEILNKYKI